MEVEAAATVVTVQQALQEVRLREILTHLLEPLAQTESEVQPPSELAVQRAVEADPVALKTTTTLLRLEHVQVLQGATGLRGLQVNTQLLLGCLVVVVAVAAVVVVVVQADNSLTVHYR